MIACAVQHASRAESIIAVVFFSLLLLIAVGAMIYAWRNP